jgi:protein SCO1/2
MSKKLVIYIGFFTLLFAGFYIALTFYEGGDMWRKKLPRISEVKPFTFVNQLGDTITERHVAGRVQVVEFFFSTCKGICPKMNASMQQIEKEFNAEEDLIFLSHTVDPETDSVGRLKRFADSLKINPARWWLLTGPKEKLYEAARKSYKLDNQQDETAAIEDQFIHTQLFALVDKQGYVRGIYDGLDKKEMKKLSRDIPLILKESYSGPRFVNGIFQNNPN